MQENVKEGNTVSKDIAEDVTRCCTLMLGYALHCTAQFRFCLVEIIRNT